MDHDYELASYDRTSNHIFDKNKLSKEFRYWQHIAPTRAEEEMTVRGSWEHKNFKKSWNTSKEDAQAARDAKRDAVRSRKADKESPSAAPAEVDMTLRKIAGGKAPWEETEEIKEQRRQQALLRKKLRAAQRGEA